MASIIANFSPNELIDNTKEEEKELLDDKEAPQPSMVICLNDGRHDEQGEEDYDEEEEEEDEKDRLFLYRLELHLLGGVIAPPRPFNNIHPQQQQELFAARLDGGYIDHSFVADCAVDELSALALDANGFFWTNDGMLNQQHYQQTFPRPPTPAAPTNSWTHSSRASAVVNMEHTRLVKMLTTEIQWAKLFPSFVFKVTTLRFLSRGSSSRNPDGSLQLLYTRLQAPTPLLPRRAFGFLRTCKQIDHLTWVIADVPIDRSRNVGFPCGCLVRGMAGGFSQVIWVEHVEVEENYLDRNLYTDLTCRGFAYGAERWVACLERSCERRFFRKTDFLVPFLPAKVDPCLEDPWREKKSVMRLSQRMVSHFCSNISFCNIRQQLVSCVPGTRNLKVYLDLCQSPYHDDPKEMLIISATTFTLPYSPDFVFGILGDEHTRHEWDVSGKISPFTKPTCYTTGSDPRNKIYVYQTHRWIYNEVVLQEASVNRSGSLLVWAELKSDKLDLVKGGQGPLHPLIRLSGLAISSNHHQNTTSSSNTGGGSIVTLGTQQEVHDVKEIEPRMLDFVRNCMGEAVYRIETVLNKAAARTVSQRSPLFNFTPTRGGSAIGVTAKTMSPLFNSSSTRGSAIGVTAKTMSPLFNSSSTRGSATGVTSQTMQVHTESAVQLYINKWISNRGDSSNHESAAQLKTNEGISKMGDCTNRSTGREFSCL